MVQTRTHLLRCVDETNHLQRVELRIKKIRFALRSMNKLRPAHNRRWIRLRLVGLRMKLCERLSYRQRILARFHTLYGRLKRRNRVCVKTKEEMAEILAMKKRGWDGVIVIAATSPEPDHLRRIALAENIMVVPSFEKCKPWLIKNAPELYPNLLKGIKLSDASKKFGKKFANGASVVKGLTEKEQINVQGDISYDIVEYITETWPAVPETAIFFIEDGKKVPAA